MSILALKLLLVPALLALAGLAARRFGHAAGGWVTALPIIAGPIVLIMALEHGTEFGARAARGTLLGLVSVASFCTAYGWLALRRGWPTALAVSWAVVAVMTLLLSTITLSLASSIVLVVFALVLSHRLLPAAGRVGASVPRYREIALRMVAGVAMVLLTTALADWLGSRLSGLVASLPVGATVTAVFSHRFHGAAAVIRLMRAMVPGLASFAAFFLVCALTLQSLGVWAAFALASAVSLAAHAMLMSGLWWWARHRGAAPARSMP